MISSNFLFEIINVVRFVKYEGCTSDPNIFSQISETDADATTVNNHGVITLLGNDLSTFSIKDNPVSSNGSKSLPKNLPDCPMLCNWAFDNLILAEELFAKGFWSLETCVLVYNNLWRKLFSLLESPTKFDEIFKVTSAPLSTPNFNLLTSELDNLRFKVLYWYYIKTK